MDKSLIGTNQSAKVALNRSKKLLDITNRILEKKNISYDQNKIIEFEDNIKAWVDKETGLMWEIKNEKNAENIYVKTKKYINHIYRGEKLNHQDTEGYIEHLNSINYSGYSDWRMPTLKELSTLFFEKHDYHDVADLYKLRDYPLKPNGLSFYIKTPLLRNTQNWYWALEIHPLNDDSDFIHFDYCGAGSTIHEPAKALRCVRRSSKLKKNKKEIQVIKSNKSFINKLFEWANKNEISEKHEVEVRGGTNYFSGFPYSELELLSINELVIKKDWFLGVNALTSISKSIGELTNLKLIDFSDHLINKIPLTIGKLKNLETLKLDSNQIEELPKEIGNLSDLRCLSLSRNFSTELPKEIGNLKKLETLELSSNQIEELPKEIGNLSNLRYLDLSNNLLTELPKEICSLNKLEELSVSWNQLIKLPNNIGKLKNLKSLSINGSSIKSLPDSIISLKNLTSFTLSNCSNLVLTEKQKNWIKTINKQDLFVEKNYIFDTDDEEIPF